MTETSYVKRTMDALMEELTRLDAAKTVDEVATATSHARAVVSVANQVFQGQRTSIETVRLRKEMEKSAPTSKRPLVEPGRHRITEPPRQLEEPYYAKRRAALAEEDARIVMESLNG